jgi:hypothetical protein
MVMRSSAGRPVNDMVAVDVSRELGTSVRVLLMDLVGSISMETRGTIVRLEAR